MKEISVLMLIDLPKSGWPKIATNDHVAHYVATFLKENHFYNITFSNIHEISCISIGRILNQDIMMDICSLFRRNVNLDICGIEY